MSAQAPLTDVPQTERLLASSPTVNDYVAAVSEYVIASPTLTPHTKKRAQVVLSNGLARALAAELTARVPGMRLRPGETNVAGALRVVKADLSETHHLDGLRLAVELKPVNLAVGRAIWNRFGDIRTFAVNIHLKFPFAVVGGVLAIPAWEWKTRDGELVQVSTRRLIERATDRLARAGGRRTEGDAAHLLEGVAVLVYDPNTGQPDELLPPPGSGLRWSEFVNALVHAYVARFEGVEEAIAAADS